VEPTELKTSIGIVQVKAMSRERLSVQSPGLSASSGALPYVLLDLWREGDGWEMDSNPYYYDERDGDGCAVRSQMPQALNEEVSKLAIEWANAHPEEFEQAAKEEFDDLIGYITHDFLDEIAAKLKEAHEATSKALKEPEFMLHASVALRRRVKSEAQRLRVMRGQIRGATKAIITLAGRRRPLGPENRRAV
jgi:hypothetical protein